MKQLGLAIIRFPQFLFEQLTGITVAILNDTEVFWVAVATALLAFAINPFIAGAAGVASWVYLRCAAQRADLVAKQIQFTALVIRDRPLTSQESDGT